MSEIANTIKADLSPLDELARQARFYAAVGGMNLLQMGRVLAEARPMIQHGAWEGWVLENAKMSVSSADHAIQAYQKYGFDERVAALGTSKILKLLPMTKAEEEKLLAENDVSGMSTRALDKAIRAQREQMRAEAMAEAQAAIDEANEARDDAEARLAELERRSAAIDDEALKAARAEALNEARQEIDEALEGQTHFAEMARKANTEKAQAERERDQARADLDEANDLLQEQQEAMNRAQEELLNLKSAQARGDAERPAGDDLSIDVFGRAVREFIGLCARMPYMQTTFGAMPQAEKNEYGELLRTVEGWATGARKALESVTVEGGIIVG